VCGKYTTVITISTSNFYEPSLVIYISITKGLFFFKFAGEDKKTIVKQPPPEAISCSKEYPLQEI